MHSRCRGESSAPFCVFHPKESRSHFALLQNGSCYFYWCEGAVTGRVTAEGESKVLLPCTRELVIFFAFHFDDFAGLSMDVVGIFQLTVLKINFPNRFATLAVKVNLQIADICLGNAGFF